MASGISADRLLSQAAAPARWPIGRTGRAGRWLRRPIAGCSGQALLRRAGRSIAPAAPVPLFLNKERNPAAHHDLCDWCSTPVRTAAEGPRGGRVPAAVLAPEGSATASLGAGLPRPVQLAGPGPLGRAAWGLQAYNSALCAKRAKSERLHSVCICNKPHWTRVERACAFRKTHQRPDVG